MIVSGSTVNDQTPNLRVAWLFPSLERGSYWHPLFRLFSQKYRETVIYTGIWSGFAAGFEKAFEVEVVGKTKLLSTTKTDSGYNRTYIFPSLKIIPKLLAFRPDVIFTSAFSLWTLVALFFKVFLGSRVIVLFDGVSPGVDYLNSGIRIFPRRIMSRLIDAYIANSHAGGDYLTKVVWADASQVFVKPYLVPDVSVLSQRSQAEPSELPAIKHLIDTDAMKGTIFLTVGQIVSRKGLSFLLQACALLKAQDCGDFTVLMIGEGDERSHLEALTKDQGLEDCIQWLGAVEYHNLGAYFNQADVFVFPTLEDIWGMVVPEAMAFGKPVLCSKWAGATEIMADGDNGFIFDPYDPHQLSALMQRFIEQPKLIESMGAQSKELAVSLTPQSAATFFCNLAMAH